MINQEKVKLMTEAAVFEQGAESGNLRLKLSFESKKDRRIFKLRNLFLGGSVYLMIMMIVYLLWGHGLLDFRVMTPALVAILAAAVIVGAGFTVLYCLTAERISRRKYRNIRSSTVKYDLIKEKLSKEE